MEDCYQFWKEHSYDIPTFLSIKNFMDRNNVIWKRHFTGFERGQ